MAESGLDPDKEISIHAPLTGCDDALGVLIVTLLPFQSTHPSRDATSNSWIFLPMVEISIHAPLTGCDVQVA